MSLGIKPLPQMVILAGYLKSKLPATPSVESSMLIMVKDKNMEDLLKQVECMPCTSGTSMITLTVPPGEQVTRVRSFLKDEIASAANIQSRT